MAKKQIPRLLASELEILEMLWRTGNVTIVEGQRALGTRAGYTTVQTRLNRMVKKGLVKRSRGKPARYSAGVTSTDVATRDLDLLLEKVSCGSVLPLVTHLVKNRSLSVDEVQELRQLINDAERQFESKQQGEREP